MLSQDRRLRSASPPRSDLWTQDEPRGPLSPRPAAGTLCRPGCGRPALRQSREDEGQDFPTGRRDERL